VLACEAVSNSVTITSSNAKGDKKIGQEQFYKVLAFLPSREGLFCKTCVLFGPLAAGRNPSQLNKLVVTPLTSYDRLFGANGYITSHENAEYHKNSVVRAASFLASVAQHTDIQTSLDSARSQQIVENRLRLKPIVSTIILYGTQNIPLCGHRDDGTLPVLNDTEADCSHK